jgi:hypothetical protein
MCADLTDRVLRMQYVAGTIAALLLNTGYRGQPFAAWSCACCPL